MCLEILGDRGKSVGAGQEGTDSEFALASHEVSFICHPSWSGSEEGGEGGDSTREARERIIPKSYTPALSK